MAQPVHGSKRGRVDHRDVSVVELIESRLEACRGGTRDTVWADQWRRSHLDKFAVVDILNLCRSRQEGGSLVEQH